MGKKPSTREFIPPEVAMFGNRFTRKWQASATNFKTYRTWWQLFYTAALNRFKWYGMPEGIDTRYLELSLFFEGTAALTRRTAKPDQPLPYIVGKYATEGKLDAYNNPNGIRITTANGQQFTRHANYWVQRQGNQYGTHERLMTPNAAVCWDNIARLPMFNVIDLACRRLAEFDVTIDQHVRSQRVPYVLVVPEEGRGNADAMFNKIERGDPAIYISPTGANVLTVNCLQTGIDYVADKLLNDELKIVSQTYTALGIDNNAAAEKKERVQTAETVANNEQFLIQRASFMDARAKFCEDAFKTFGLDIWCEWSAPHTWEDGADSVGYNNALETSTATPKYGTSKELFGGKGNVSVDNAI